MEMTVTPSSKIRNVARPLKLVDHNSKKHCKCMVELNFAPAAGILESQLDSTVFNVTWNDGSTGDYILYDLIRLELFDVLTVHSWPSHGMDNYEYVSWILSQFPDLKKTTAMALYFYKRVEIGKV